MENCCIWAQQHLKELMLHHCPHHCPHHCHCHCHCHGHCHCHCHCHCHHHHHHHHCLNMNMGFIGNQLKPRISSNCSKRKMYGREKKTRSSLVWEFQETSENLHSQNSQSNWSRWRCIHRSYVVPDVICSGKCSTIHIMTPKSLQETLEMPTYMPR